MFDIIRLFYPAKRKIKKLVGELHVVRSREHTAASLMQVIVQQIANRTAASCYDETSCKLHCNQIVLQIHVTHEIIILIITKI